MEIGITTFAETLPDPVTGAQMDHGRRIAEVVEEAVVAEEVGLDVFGLGEHHREDFAASAPAMVLAAVAARTERIRLTPAVTVLSSDDPVRVFQQYATLDLLSRGRAELLVGRGSFTESFPLFGYSLADYDALFAEKLDLLLALRDHERVTWSGRFRPPLKDQPVYPRPHQDPFPIGVAVGGNPGSAVRAGLLGLPMTLAIIGGDPARFAVFSQLHRRALAEAGHDPRTAPLAVHGHGFVAGTVEEAVEVFYPPYELAMRRIGAERGWSPMSRIAFDAMRAPGGSLVLGRPDDVADKIVRWREILGVERFMLHMSVGTLRHADVLRSIELLGTEVAPRVRKALGE